MARLGALLAVVLMCACGCHSGSGAAPATHGLRLAGRVAGSIPPAPSAKRPWVVTARFFTARDGVMVVSPCRAEMCPREQVLATRDGGRHWSIEGGLSRPDAAVFSSRRVGFALRHACSRRHCTVSVWATADGGRAWRRRGAFAFGTHPHQFDLVGAASVDIVSPRSLWVSFGGLLEHSRDGGVSWSRASFPCPREYGALFSVSFSDDRHGAAGCSWGQGAAGLQGKEILTTADGGATWTVAATAGRRGSLPMIGYGAAVESVSPSHGYLVTERGGLYVTDDGWRSLRSLLFTDDEAITTGTTWPTPRVGYAVAEGELFGSADGGRTWLQVYPRPVVEPGGAVTFMPALRGRPAYGIAGGSTAYSFLGGPAQVLRTRRGAGWTGVASLGRPIQTVAHDGETLYALAGDPLERSSVYRSTDRGARWTLVGSAPSSFWLSAAGGTLYLESSEGRLLRSTAGRRWTTVFQHRLWDIEFTSAEDGVALNQVSQILRTTDGGRRWIPLRDQPGVPNVEAVAALGSHVWVAGGTCAPSPCRGELAWTPDLGRHWQVISYPRLPGTSYGQLVFTSPRVGYLVRDGRTLRTADGGRTWTPLQ